MAAYSTSGYGSDYINQQIAAASGQGTGTYYQKTLSGSEPKRNDRPTITGGPRQTTPTFSGLTNTPENQALFGAQTFAAPAPSPLQQKDVIEQGVVDRGLLSGASGAASGVGVSPVYSSEQLAEMARRHRPTPTSSSVGGNPNTGVTTGDGGGDPPGPSAPVGPGAPTTGVGDNFGQYTEAEIDAALRGIEAEFGMTREQLLQDKSMIGAQYRLLMARMARAREQAIASTTSDAVSRGIYRSGILGENIGNVEQQYQEESAGARQQQQIQEQTLERQLALLDQGQAARGAQVQNQILGQAAATMQQAGIGPAAAGFTGGVPVMETAPTPVPAANPYEQSQLLALLREQQRLGQGAD